MLASSSSHLTHSALDFPVVYLFDVNAREVLVQRMLVVVEDWHQLDMVPRWLSVDVLQCHESVRGLVGDG